MSSVPQDARHHAEGNVAIHTKMVLEALENLSEYNELEKEDKEILWASALLHDVEKFSTTVTEPDGSITAHGHARKGAMKSRQILFREIKTSFGIREQIVGLVRYRGLPLWLLEKPDPLKTIIKASIEVNTKLLAQLAKADAAGRICQDKGELLYRIDCFEEYCREHGCWGQPRSFPSSHAMMYYLQKEYATPNYLPFDEPSFEVVLMSGIPGSGKDIFIRKHLGDLPAISLDLQANGKRSACYK